MPYIYESHLGGLYTTNEHLGWDELYCETCGDSDWEIGYAGDVAEAWKILGPETDGCGVCDTCPLAEAEADADDNDDPFAELECCKKCTNPDAGYGTWDMLYMMNFLDQNFDKGDIKPIYVYLVCRNRSGSVLASQIKHELPHSFCPEKEHVWTVVRQLCGYAEHPDMDTLTKVHILHGSDAVYYIFEVEDKTEDESKSAVSCDRFRESSYFWYKTDELRLSETSGKVWKAYQNAKNRKKTTR